MITGLFVKLSTEELYAILTGRVVHHQQRVKLYSEQMVVLAEGETEEQAINKFSNVSNSPYVSLRDSKKAHEKKIAYFTFFRDHLVPNDHYLLSQHDLQTLEIVQY